MTFLKLLYGSALALLLFSGLAYLGTVWWWADLFAHFRPHLAAASALITLAFLACRRRWVALSCLVIVGVSMAPVLADFTYKGVQVPDPDIRILAWNVHYQNDDPAAGVAMMRRHDADVLVLSETSRRWQHALESLKDVYPFQLHAVDCDFVGCEMSVLSKRAWQHAEVRTLVPGTPQTIAVEFGERGSTPVYSVVAVHLINFLVGRGGERQRAQIAALGAWVKTLTGTVILGGDMNAAPSSATFRSIAVATGLDPADLSLTPTWPSPAGPLGISIDHFFTRGIENISVRRLGAYGSDHVALEASVGFGQ